MRRSTGLSSDTTLSVDAIGPQVTIDIRDLQVACDPDAAIDLDIAEGVIRVDITDDGDTVCTCIRDLTITISDVDIGDWLIDVYFNGQYIDTVVTTVDADL